MGQTKILIMGYLEERLLRKTGQMPPLPTRKERKPIPKKSAKKIAEEKKEREQRGGEDTELVKWYKRQMKFMNVCEETGMKVETHIYRYAIMSICHLLPKSTCPSVATHPLNRVFLLPDLHAKFDSLSWEEKETWSCWPVIKERLILMHPSVAPEEMRHFPESVLKYIKENDFIGYELILKK